MLIKPYSALRRLISHKAAPYQIKPCSAEIALQTKSGCGPILGTVTEIPAMPPGSAGLIKAQGRRPGLLSQIPLHVGSTLAILWPSAG